MTGAVHRAGVAVQASDVPGDLLARAAAARVVSVAAAVLTGLFGRARFRSQPVTEADRQAAAAALARIRADLERPP